MSTTPLARMLLSLDGTSVGDGFGMRVLRDPACLETRALPPPSWRWSDDTHMTLSVVENLAAHDGAIAQDELAAAFAARYDAEPRRGYGHGMRVLLERIAAGGAWRELSRALFSGEGSLGNGAAMRAAPIGAFHAGDPARAAREAQRAAEVTHAHPEGQAGGVAVAVAAALVAGAQGALRGDALLDAVLARTPPGGVADGIAAARAIAPNETARAAEVLGAGRMITAADTVPFCLWCAAHHTREFEDALWATASGLDDADTTCAIVGGIVALGAGAVPAAWLAAREPLPALRLGDGVH